MSFKRYLNKSSLFVTALLCASSIGGLLPSPLISHAFADDILSRDVGLHLQDAQKALSAHNYSKASSALDAADQTAHKSEYENYVIAQMRAAIATSSGNVSAAIKAYDTLIQSPRTSKASKAQMLMAEASLAYGAKNYTQSAQAASRYLNEIGANAQMQSLLIQSYYLQENWTQLISAGEKFLQQDKQAKITPSENMLQMLATAYDRNHDTDGKTSTYVTLVQYYPKTQYWQILIHDLVSDTTLSPPLIFNVERLRLATGSLTNPKDFQDMAERAIFIGQAQLAAQLLAVGYERHILGVGPNAEHENKFRAYTLQRADMANKLLPDAVKIAEKDTTAGSAIICGYNLILNGQTDQGIALMKTGLTRNPHHPHMAQLEYGMALMDAHKNDEAISVFNQIQGDKKVENIAKLWAVYIQSTETVKKGH